MRTLHTTFDTSIECSKIHKKISVILYALTRCTCLIFEAKVHKSQNSSIRSNAAQRGQFLSRTCTEYCFFECWKESYGTNLIKLVIYCSLCLSLYRFRAYLLCPEPVRYTSKNPSFCRKQPTKFLYSQNHPMATRVPSTVFYFAVGSRHFQYARYA